MVKLRIFAIVLVAMIAGAAAAAPKSQLPPLDSGWKSLIARFRAADTARPAAPSGSEIVRATKHATPPTRIATQEEEAPCGSLWKACNSLDYNGEVCFKAWACYTKLVMGPDWY
jgi:hypothetical protein